MLECQQCGQINDDDTKFCTNCGFKLSGDKINAIKCPNCGINNKINSKYCINCGTILNEDIKSTNKFYCPYCGSELGPNVSKCKYCGEWVQKSNIKNMDKSIFLNLKNIIIGGYLLTIIGFLSILISNSTPRIALAPLILIDLVCVIFASLIAILIYVKNHEKLYHTLILLTINFGLFLACMDLISFFTSF